jgi:hypothetical protein
VVEQVEKAETEMGELVLQFQVQAVLVYNLISVERLHFTLVVAVVEPQEAMYQPQEQVD